MGKISYDFTTIQNFKKKNSLVVETIFKHKHCFRRKKGNAEKVTDKISDIKWTKKSDRHKK